MGRSRRNFLAAVGTASAVGLAGCLGGDDADFIRYLGWGGNTQDAAAEIFDRWSEESDTEIRHESAGGDVEMLSFLQQNPGEVDLFLSSSFGVSQGRDEGLLADIDYSEVPNYEDNIRETWRDVPYIEGDAFFRSYAPQGISYNTEVIDDEPTSWQDIKNEEFVGDLLLRDDAASRFDNAALAIGADVNDLPGDEDLYSAVVEEMIEQDQSAFAYWGSGAQSMQYLQEENAMIAEAWSGRTRAIQQDGYEHIEFVFPEEGTTVVTEDYAIPADSENQSEVYDLLNFAYEPENLVDISDMLGYPVPMIDTPDLIREIPGFVEEPDELSFIDWEEVIPVLDDWQAEFDRIKTT